MAAAPVATAAARVAVLVGLVLVGFVLMAAAAVTVVVAYMRVVMDMAAVTVALFVAVHHWAPSPCSLGT
jgi:hypothetical protein